MRSESSMSLNILLIGAGVPNQVVAFEEPGLASIAAYLRKYGYNVKIMLALDDANLSIKEIVEFNPSIMGLSVYNETFEVVKRLCIELKNALNNTLIRLGGYVPTYYPNEIMNEISSADYLIIGEGEISFLNLVNCLRDNGDLANVDGLAYRKNNSIVINKNQALISDLDILPFPSRDISGQFNVLYAWIMSSRGCTRNCGFCCSRTFWPVWRGHSVNYIVDEIQTIISKYGIRFFEFGDNSYEDPYPYLERALSISDELINRDISISYGIGMRSETFQLITADQLNKLKQSGLAHVFLGTEAFNSSDLAFYQKSATLEQNVHSIEYFQANDIAVEIGFINFNPYTTVNSLRENIKYLHYYNFGLPPYIFSFLKLFKGNRNYTRINNDGLLINNNINDVYCYKYLNTNINSLSNYLHEVQDALENSDEREIWNNLITFRKKHAHIIGLFTRLNIINENILTMMNDTKKSIDMMRKDKNKIYSHWFNKLLDTVEKGYDDKKVEEISTRYLFDLLDETLLLKLKNILFKYYFEAMKHFRYNNVNISHL